jgi:MSHA pilin protein MshC
MKTENGFTLIELITVMLLIGILSVVAFSRFSDTSVYRQALFISKVQVYLRLAQQISMSQQPPNRALAVTVFSLQQTSDSQWAVMISNHNGSQSYLLDSRAELQIDKQTLSQDSALELTFDSRGDLKTMVSPKALNITHSIALQAGKNSICIAPTGYSYEGQCI